MCNYSTGKVSNSRCFTHNNYHDFNLFCFCSLLLRRECCSFSNGEYVKAGLAELEHWCYEATEEVNIGSLLWHCSPMVFWKGFLNIHLHFHTVCRLCLGRTQAYQTGSWIPGISSLATEDIFSHPHTPPFSRVSYPYFLMRQVIHQKPKKTLNEITKDLCPVRDPSFQPHFLPKTFFIYCVSRYGFSYSYSPCFRFWAYSNYTGSAPCIGMTSMVHTVCLLK